MRTAPGGLDPITFSCGTGFTVAMLDAGVLTYVPEGRRERCRLCQLRLPGDG